MKTYTRDDTVHGELYVLRSDAIAEIDDLRNNLDKASISTECAHRIASVAAEELIRCEGVPTGAPDEYMIAQCQADDHMRDCITHLRWHGEAVSFDTDDGHIIVQFGDFTIGGGA